MKILLSSIVGLSAMVLVASPAMALDDGPYAGFSLGQASFEDRNIDDIDLDDDSSAWKIFGGLRWGILAVEGGYRDFGDAGDLGGNVEVTGVDGYGVLTLPVGPVDLFGKFGTIYWDSDTKVGMINVGDDGIGVAGGIGAAIRLGSFAIRAEYELFDVDAVDDLNMYSIGATYTF